MGKGIQVGGSSLSFAICFIRFQNVAVYGKNHHILQKKITLNLTKKKKGFFYDPSLRKTTA